MNPELPTENNPPQRCSFSQCISNFWTKYLDIDPLWLKEVRGHLITAGALTATMAYQSILSPPGSFWQDGGDVKYNAGSASPPMSHDAGQAIMDSKSSFRYAAYLFINTLVLIGSLSTIMLAMTGFPIKNKILTWLLIFTVYITISCMVAAYALAMSLISPNLWKSSWDILLVPFLGWVGLCVFVAVLHSCHFLVWLVTKLAKLVKACYRCCVPKDADKNKTNEVNSGGKP